MRLKRIVPKRKARAISAHRRLPRAITRVSCYCMRDRGKARYKISIYRQSVVNASELGNRWYAQRKTTGHHLLPETVLWSLWSLIIQKAARERKVVSEPPPKRVRYRNNARALFVETPGAYRAALVEVHPAAFCGTSSKRMQGLWPDACLMWSQYPRCPTRKKHTK